MAKIVSKIISFTPSNSPDIAGYRLYYTPEADTLDYNSLFIDLGVRVSNINLATFDAMIGLDGVYQIGVCAYDEVGNESDFLTGIVPLDFTAPSAPSDLVIQ